MSTPTAWEYFPKGADIRAICNEDVQKVQDRVNTRKALGSSTEVMFDLEVKPS